MKIACFGEAHEGRKVSVSPWQDDGKFSLIVEGGVDEATADPDEAVSTYEWIQGRQFGR